MIIPMEAEIRRRFSTDVTVPMWRREPDAAQPALELAGSQSELFDCLMVKARRYEEIRATVVSGLATEEAVMGRAAQARELFRHVQGLATLPERTAMNPRVAAGYQCNGFHVEHIIFESRPRLYVTANLYLPDDFAPPFPAVLFVMGHSPIGKANPKYQGICSVLARRGFAVLATDPAGQGERDEYVDVATGVRTVPRACRMHTVAGDPMYLTGQSFGGYRLWDSMRALDYLQSRDDIDPDRLGVTGTSGGGWESLWLGATDTRVQAVFSSCYLTTWRRRMENRAADAEPDPEQDPFGVISAGFDAADLILACAPRAVAVGATLFDFFPFDGALQCYEEMRQLFEIAGLGEKIGFSVGNAGHDWSLVNREACYAWMQRWLMDNDSPDKAELPPISVAEHRTWCTEKGIVLSSIGGVSSAEDHAVQTVGLMERRAPLSGQALREKVAESLGISGIPDTVDVEWGAEHVLPGMIVREMRLRTDELWNTARVWTPSSAIASSGVVLLEEKSPDYLPLQNSLCVQLCQRGLCVMDFDPSGMGPVDEVMYDFVPLGEANLAYDAFLLGMSLSGLRVLDVLGAISYLRPGLERVGIVGRGYGAQLALLSSVIDDRVGAVVQDRGLSTLASLVLNRDYVWHVNSIVPGALQWYDLPLLRLSLHDRAQLILTPLDHLKVPVSDSISVGLPEKSVCILGRQDDPDTVIADFLLAGKTS